MANLPAVNRMTHLLEPDARLFREYLEMYPDRYRWLEFDIHVGLGRDPGPDFDRTMRNMAIRLSQRRIDAVGLRPGQIDIIEVTLSAGIRALGQLLAYPQLYEFSFSAVMPLNPVLVAREFATDTEHLYSRHGIETYILPG